MPLSSALRSPTKMTNVQLSIVVLQLNRHDLTKECVDSIRSTTTAEYELIIVDNGSEDPASNWASEAADVAVLLDTNEGFARGMNAGLHRANGSIIAFVNNDTTVPPNWDSMLLETVDTPGVGIAVPAVTAGGNVSSVRSEPGTATRLARPFIDLPSGVFYVMRTDLIRSLGGWSEDYPVASSEDLDLLFSTWAIGLDVVIDDRILIQHVGSATASTQLPSLGRIWRDNRKHFVENWADMTDGSFRERYDWDGEILENRLEQARIAAYWMGRYFKESDDLARALSKARPAAADSAKMPASRRRRWRRKPS